MKMDRLSMKNLTLVKVRRDYTCCEHTIPVGIENILKETEQIIVFCAFPV